MDRSIKKYLNDILHAIKEIELYLTQRLLSNIKHILRTACFEMPLNVK